ncbi:MAG: mechanosensitive ion channel [Sedimentisphaerales bacterium]|nr:mechanosensitive ion channel [Sedimentisphaerales bacterium]
MLILADIVEVAGSFLWPAGTVVIAVAIAFVVHFILFFVLKRMAKETDTPLDESLVKHFRSPMLCVTILIALRVVMPLLSLSEDVLTACKQVFSLTLIASVSWLLIKSVYVLDDYVRFRYDIRAKDNLRARRIQTQLSVLKRLVIIVVSIIALGTMLMTFERVRQLGTSLLASAGIAGLVIGFAAQKTLATFVAGLQIAFTQPIRFDDVVIVEGEWGRIEEITLTYVVIRIWDQRRLVVPITYFIEKPFQNWTRTSAEMLGTIFLYVDHSVPIDAIRKRLREIVEGSEWWDGRVCGVQVTNTTEKCIEARALISSADSSGAWELRCLVREKLIDFLQQNYPGSLPRFRAEVEQHNPPGTEARPELV